MISPKLIFLIAFAAASVVPAFSDQNINPPAPMPGLAGDWEGSLVVPGASIPLVFHFSLTNGTYSLTVDSPNQGAFGLIGGKVSFDGTNVTADVPPVHGEFDGKISSDGLSIVGTWSQGSPLPLTLTKAAAQAPSDPIPPSALGDWSGTLAANGQTLHLIFHFVQQGTAVAAYGDCPEQKLLGIGGSPISYHSGVITAPFPSLNGFLTGTISADGSTFNGTWKQVGEQPITLQHSQPVPPAPLPDFLSGTWLGNLTVPSGSLRAVLSFAKDAAGDLSVTFASPDQTGAVYRGVLTSEPDGVFTANFDKIGISYRGKATVDHQTLYGLLAQSGHTIGLSLTKTSAVIAPASRPQNPTPPYPYLVQEITFPSVAPNVRLAGTLTIPKGEKKWPAVVLIAGSGGQDRNENIFGHQIFGVIADYLTRCGFVVLRYDKRGIGESTGVFGSSTVYDFANDAQSAVNYLKTVKEVDPHRIGLIGHSEGGMIAPLVAVRDHDVKFIVLLAGPGVSGVDVLLRQQVLIAQGEGAPKNFIKKNEHYLQIALPLASKSDGNPQDRAKLVALYQKVFASDGSPAELAAQIAPAIETIFTPWYRSFLGFDPQEYLTKLTVPVLALNGSHDRQVDPLQNLPAIRSALSRADAGKFETIEIPGLNHLFQDSKTGAFSEYNQIGETFSPKALQIIGHWLTKTTSH